MTTNKSIDQLKLDLKVSLGYPVVDIELEDVQLEYAVNRAIEMYHKFSYNLGSTKDWLLIQTTGGSAYSVPTDVAAIISKQVGADNLYGNISQLFTFENVMWNVGALNVWSWGSFGLLTYEMSLQYLEMMRQMLVSKYSVRFSKEENMVFVSPVPSAGSVLFLECYRETPAVKLYDNIWVLSWAKAECKEILGRIRSKYVRQPGPGGDLQMDGEVLLREAQQEKDNLYQQVLRQETPPPIFMWG